MARTGAPAELRPPNGEKPVSFGRDAHIIKGQQQATTLVTAFLCSQRITTASQNLPGSGPAECGVQALCQQADMA
ncbi:hypothetical protein MHYP_G00134610 [Metynnis hypsauchen]